MRMGVVTKIFKNQEEKQYEKSNGTYVIAGDGIIIGSLHNRRNNGVGSIGRLCGRLQEQKSIPGRRKIRLYMPIRMIRSPLVRFVSRNLVTRR